MATRRKGLVRRRTAMGIGRVPRSRRPTVDRSTVGRRERGTLHTSTVKPTRPGCVLNVSLDALDDLPAAVSHLRYSWRRAASRMHWARATTLTDHRCAAAAASPATRSAIRPGAVAADGLSEVQHEQGSHRSCTATVWRKPALLPEAGSVREGTRRGKSPVREGERPGRCGLLVLTRTVRPHDRFAQFIPT